MKILMFSTLNPCRLREKFPFQLIDAYYFYPDGVAAITLSRRFTVPVVITARGTNLNLIFRYPWSRWLIQWVAGMITVCQVLKDVLVDLGVPAERVRFLGALPYAGLKDWYGAADCLVLASSREGWANVLLESMAAEVRALLANSPLRMATQAYAKGFSWDTTSQGQKALFGRTLAEKAA